jgi:anaphase-promoting complex subunit 5
VDAWRAGDYPTAFDLLRRYFDYTMQNRDRLFYQYALMNLAVLQADFGCHREALGAMLETVSTARENRDMTCLNFSLNWLFHFSCAHPQLIRELDLFEGGTGKSHIGIVNNTAGGAARASDNHSILGAGKESLAYLRVKARETDMWPLWSAVLLSEAKHSLSHGDSVASALEAMARSSHVIVEHSLTNLFGPFLGLQASLWDRLGLGWLAEQSCDLFLRLHSRSAMFDDELRVSCRLAAAAGARGDYAEAMDILKRLEGDPLRSWRPAQFCQKYRDMIDLTRALNRGGAALVTAEATLLHQTLMQNRFDDMEPDLGFAIDALHVECMMARGDLSAAFAEVDHMADVVEEEDRDVLLRARLLLLKARLYDAAGRPRRGFTVALRAAALAWRARLLHVLWEAIGLVANVLTALAEFGAAAHLLTAVLPRALETGDARLAAWLFSLLADARMGIAGAASRGSRARQEWLGSALDAVQCSLGEYAKVENVRKQAEMVAKKAMIARLGGDKRLAAECAAAHATLREAAVAA